MVQQSNFMGEINQLISKLGVFIEKNLHILLN